MNDCKSWMTPAQQEYFWSKVQRADHCWTWTLSFNHKGYARACVNSKEYPAHRIAYELAVGPIPQGLEIDHLCRNRSCVNPAHMEPVTHLENVRRALFCADSFACGHTTAAENVYAPPGNSSRRNCRVCKREINNRYKRRLAQKRRGVVAEGVSL